MGDLRGISMLDSKSILELENLEEDLFAATKQTSIKNYFEEADKMLSAEYFGNFFDVVQPHTESNDIHKTAVFEIKTNGAILVMNASLNATETAFVPELFYRHSMAMTAVYCVAYLLVFALGLVGNFFVIAVVFRSPRMRTVTNFFIVNLAVADILVIVFCLPATLMSNIFVRRVIIYGGKGALGARCVSHFKTNNFWVGCIDLAENGEADCNIIVKKEEIFQQQETSILSSVDSALNGSKVDGVFCVAGGWAGGSSKKDLAKTAELMWQQSVCSSLISASIAANHLKEGGIIQLTGAKAALEGTPGMIGYGLAKAAVQQLTKSLAQSGSGLPNETFVVAILPTTLDTPMNRKWMPKSDFSTWTPLDFIADLFLKWSLGKERPQNGTLLQLVTMNFKTELVPA